MQKMTKNRSPMHTKKKIYSMTFDPKLIHAVDKAVKYFGIKSRSEFLTTAIENYLVKLHKEIENENK